MRERRRNDPIAYQIYCDKERERNAKRRAKGVESKFKKSQDCTQRELRARRKKQVQWARTFRSKLKAKSDRQNLIDPHVDDGLNGVEQEGMYTMIIFCRCERIIEKVCSWLNEIFYR